MLPPVLRLDLRIVSACVHREQASFPQAKEKWRRFVNENLRTGAPKMGKT